MNCGNFQVKTNLIECSSDRFQFSIGWRSVLDHSSNVNINYSLLTCIFLILTLTAFLLFLRNKKYRLLIEKFESKGQRMQGKLRIDSIAKLGPFELRSNVNELKIESPGFSAPLKYRPLFPPGLKGRGILSTYEDNEDVHFYYISPEEIALAAEIEHAKSTSAIHWVLLAIFALLLTAILLVLSY